MTKTIRRDHWSQEQDQLLIKTVLSYIKNGGTQLQAFEEVGKLLQRTSGACGFRWNFALREQCKQEIAAAKTKRLVLKSKGKPTKVKNKAADVAPKTIVDDMIGMLFQVKGLLMSKDNEIALLEARLEDLTGGINPSQKEHIS